MWYFVVEIATFAVRVRATRPRFSDALRRERWEGRAHYTLRRAAENLGRNRAYTAREFRYIQVACSGSD